MQTVVLFIFLALSLVSCDQKTQNLTSSSRFPANIPAQYDSFKACEKQLILWEKIQSTVHQDLPEYKKFGALELLSMGLQEISLKAEHYSDFAPDGWRKYLHRRGSVAKVKIIPVKNQPYSGVFKGAECGLLRLSLTYRPSGDKPVAPGLALKVLRDDSPSANVSALVSLEGQEKNFNFFKYPMSNIVPAVGALGHKLVHRIFKRVSRYPEELLLSDMAAFDEHGQKALALTGPRQIFFVPGAQLKFPEDEHEIRDDFMKIKSGTVVYQIYALGDKFKDFEYSDYSNEDTRKFLKNSIHVADIVTTSEFVSSEFGDDGLFFRHQIRESK